MRNVHVPNVLEMTLRLGQLDIVDAREDTGQDFLMTAARREIFLKEILPNLTMQPTTVGNISGRSAALTLASINYSATLVPRSSLC